jgi:hypothetical protein
VTVVGAAVILGVVVAVPVKMKVARPSVAIVCIVFGLVLGATPIGDGVDAAVAAVGRWLSDMVGGL